MGDATFGCLRCFGEDAPTAWAATRTSRLRALVEESHFSLQLTACACGQRFVTVFTERVDWSGGEDDQTWLALPVALTEAQQLEGASPAELPALVRSFGPGRRFLVRSFPTGGELSVWWRADGFSIGPHD